MMADGFGRRQSRRCCVDVACFSSFFFCCLPISHPTLQPEQHHAESVSGHSVIFFFFQKKKNIFSPNFLKKKTNGSDLLCRISCNGGWCVSIVCGKPALFLITMFLFCCLFDSTLLYFPSNCCTRSASPSEVTTYINAVTHQTNTTLFRLLFHFFSYHVHYVIYSLPNLMKSLYYANFTNYQDVLRQIHY